MHPPTRGSALLRALSCALGLAIASPSLRAAGPIARTALTALTLPDGPQTVGYSLAAGLPGLTFAQPIALAIPPGDDNRLFVVEQAGRIWVVPDRTAAAPTRELFLDLTDRIVSGGEQGLLCVAFHPQWASNGRFFVFYTGNATTAAGTGLHDILARFTVSPANPNRGDAASEQRLIVQYDQASNHNGSQLLFGSDGDLYVTLGDEGGGDDSLGNSQRINRDFFSGALRIDVDQRPGSLAPNPHAAVVPGTYRVPADNPWIGATAFNGTAIDPATVRTEFWAVGLRNPWRGSIDPLTGEFWVGDVGQSSREEIDILTRGGNYGWNYREGLIARPGSAAPPVGFSAIDPVIDLDRTQAFAVTGGIVYRGPKFSALFGAFLFGDYGTGNIWTLRRSTSGGAPTLTPILTEPGIAYFLADPRTGDVYLSDHDSGLVRKLAATASGTAPPNLLSATGAFTNLASLAPSAGFVAYEPNVSFWSDFAVKRRWFAQRTLTSPFGYAAAGNWTLAAGAVWMKHFDLELIRGDASSRRRLETRLLVRTADGVYGLTYRWNDAQTDATLVPEEGATADFTISDHGTTRTQHWRFPSRSECLTCHTAAGGWALSFNTRQLNRSYDYPTASANQLSALADAGYLDSTPGAPATLPALARATDPVPIETRARAWLDANCANCHQPGGSAAANFDARAATPTALTGLLGGGLINNLGDPANRLIAAGDPAHSAVVLRAGRRGALQMPPVASNETDPVGMALLTDWIRQLGDPTAANAGRLINLSTRGQVMTDAGVLIAGFVISGTGPRTFLIRGIGPALGTFGVTGPVANPRIDVYSGSTVILSNDDWATGASNAQVTQLGALVGAFPLTTGGRDAALVATLAPGIYTVHVNAVGGATGIGLVELYDADTPGTSRLVNISTRARVGAAQATLIPGLVVSAGERRLLIRGVGPGLQQFGLTDIAPNPVLSLVDRDGNEIARNDDWSTSANAVAIAAAAQATGAFALTSGSHDAALLITLQPGIYTALVTDATGGNGIALVEVYDAPLP